MTQAPTPGPLDSESVTLLVKGDLLLCKTWGVVRFDRFDDSGVRAFVLDLANDQVRLMKPINMAFIGRPDADGWMPWSGGENPVPGQRVEVRLRNGRQYEDYLSEGWAADKTGPEDYWKHGNDPYLQQLEIIAFRLAPTAPVEASGSEDLARKLTAIRDKFLMPTPDKDFTDYAIITRCIEALRPQRGETREIVEEWAAMARRATPPTGCLLRYVPISEGEINAIEALLSARPLALGGQHSGGEWRCEDCGAQADEWFDCCKNPARAEAQDEGAAGSFEERVIMLTKKHGNPVGTDYEQGQNDMGYRMVTMARDADAALAAARAHPSPPPAADADRVRALEAVADLADELINRGGLVNRGVDRGLVVVEKRDRSDPHYRLCGALEALKSTAAKEGENK